LYGRQQRGGFYFAAAHIENTGSVPLTTHRALMSHRAPTACPAPATNAPPGILLVF
jgi:hypothetical protein